MNKRLAFIILFAIALWMPGYIRRDLWQPDEARYAYVAQEMQAGNHWFVPHRHGETYAHKPPLMFWMINASSILTGGEIGKIATRLPSLLGIIMVLWASCSIANLWTDKRTALRTIFITATTFALWWRAGWGQIDMLLCGLQMISLYLLFADDMRRTRWRPTLAFCFFGLGILAKGPVGFIIPLGAYLTANLVSGKWRNLLRWHWLWCLPVTLLWPAAWLLTATLTGAPEAYLNELLFDQNVGRAAGGMGHIRPVYYYLEAMLAVGLPWIIFFPLAIWAIARGRRSACHAVSLRRRKIRCQRSEDGSQKSEINKCSGEVAPHPRASASATTSQNPEPILPLALGWFVFVVLFFSILPTKRSLYILLAYPAMAIIVSAAWSHLTELPRKILWIAAGLTATIISSAAIILLIIPRIRPDLPLSYSTTIPCAIVLIIGALSLLLNFHRFGPSLRWMYQLVGMFIVIYLMTSTILLPKFNPMKTPQSIVAEVQKRLPKDHLLVLYKINAEIMPLYCQRRGRVFWGEIDLWRYMRHITKGVAIFEASVWQNEMQDYYFLGESKTFRVGNKEYVWLEFNTRRPRH